MPAEVPSWRSELIACLSFFRCITAIFPCLLLYALPTQASPLLLSSSLSSWVCMSVCQQDLKTEQIPMKSGWQIRLRQKNIWLDVGGYSDFHLHISIHASHVILLPRVWNCVLWQDDVRDSDVYLSTSQKQSKTLSKEHLSWGNTCRSCFRIAVQWVHASCSMCRLMWTWG